MVISMYIFVSMTNVLFLWLILLSYAAPLVLPWCWLFFSVILAPLVLVLLMLLLLVLVLLLSLVLAPWCWPLSNRSILIDER